MKTLGKPLLGGWLLVWAPTFLVAAERHPKHQIVGLFCPEREADFRRLCDEKLGQLKLVSIDYARAEATFAYDAAKLFPGATAQQIVERIDNQVRDASRYTFGVKPL